jgi:D-alanyl-D-alanine carboxypeptidase/D-alanyl-D-alanine-endopeptidase (penicillin-binding protein 4)
MKIGEKVKFVSSDPNVPNLKFDVEATVAPKGSGDQSYIIGANDQLNKKLIGTLPQATKPYQIEGALPNPPLFFANSLFDKLNANGYNLCSYQLFDGIYTPKVTIIDSIVSPKLLDLIRETNHKSINVYCDAFTKHLGIQNHQPGNYENGIQYINEYLVNLGFDKKGFKLYDGSGLSSRSFITPEILAKFLSHFVKINGISNIQYILPQAGTDGSVKSLLQNSNAQAQFWLKSGSMENIQSYTGICNAKSGKWVSFSIIINNFTVTHRELKNHLEVLLANIYGLN